MPRRFRALLAAFAAAGVVSWPCLAHAGDVERGRYLYELKCGSCHSQSVHSRPNRVANDEADVRQWVRRWSDYLQLGWGEEEIEDVASYLAFAFYHFPCDPPQCRVAQAATAQPR